MTGQWRHDEVILLIMLLQTDIKVINNFLLPKFIEDYNHGCCQTEHQIQRDALGSVHTARVA